MPANQSTGDFTTQFPVPIFLRGPTFGASEEPDHVPTVALLHATFWYNTYNISSARGNNTLQFRKDPLDPWTTLTLPDGIYMLSQINESIKDALDQLSMYKIVDNIRVYAFEFVPNIATQRIEYVPMDDPDYANFQTDVMNLGALLGWPNNTVLATGGTKVSAPHPPDITGGLDTYLFHADIVDGSASFLSGTSSDVLASYSIGGTDGGPGSLITVNPQHLVFLPINQRDQIRSIRFYITDQSGNLVNFNGERVTATLVPKCHKNGR